MLDPMVSLSFSIYSGKGTYALLLGSGISRASGVPTGWEVVLDLIRKAAALEGEDCESDPAGWFRKKHKAEPDYGKLLDAIARTPTERQQLLRGYFEPTEEDQSQGIKVPSIAHKAIAQLVAAGYIRVILTTNFDRLMERALEDVGVAPTVISTVDQISGAIPLAHSGATVVKLHGDYLDTRIKNTDAELAGYEQALNHLLDRILDEYGLIICGWSAEWDVALRAAIERCPSRRYSTYWTTRSALSEPAKRLCEHRKAEILKISDANQFFDNLREKVQALSDFDAPHPLSTKMAVATVKRYLVEPSAKIRLRDLFHEQTENLVGELGGSIFPAGMTKPNHADELAFRVSKYDALCESLLSMIITGSYWGDQQHAKLWCDCLGRIANAVGGGGDFTYLVNLRRYPALLLMYGAGIAAIAAGNYKTLASILTDPKIMSNRRKEEAICVSVYPVSVMNNDVAHMLPGLDRHHTPVSDYLVERLRAPLREYIPRDEDYENRFDYFEYMLGMVHADMTRDATPDGWWGPVGRFKWRNSLYPESGVANKVEKEFEAGAQWAPLPAGLFAGSIAQARTAKQKFDIFLSTIHMH